MAAGQHNKDGSPCSRAAPDRQGRALMEGYSLQWMDKASDKRSEVKRSEVK